MRSPKVDFKTWKSAWPQRKPIATSPPRIAEVIRREACFVTHRLTTGRAPTVADLKNWLLPLSDYSEITVHFLIPKLTPLKTSNSEIDDLEQIPCVSHDVNHRCDG